MRKNNLTPEGVKRGVEKSREIRSAKRLERIEQVRILRDKGCGTGKIKSLLKVSSTTIWRYYKELDRLIEKGE